MRGAGSTIASVIPVSTVMNGRDRHAGVHERLELAEALAAAVLHRADLGDRAGRGGAAGRLEVDDDEGDVVRARSSGRRGEASVRMSERRSASVPTLANSLFDRRTVVRARKLPSDGPSATGARPAATSPASTSSATPADAGVPPLQRGRRPRPSRTRTCSTSTSSRSSAGGAGPPATRSSGALARRAAARRPCVSAAGRRSRCRRSSARRRGRSSPPAKGTVTDGPISAARTWLCPLVSALRSLCSQRRVRGRDAVEHRR